MLHAKLEQARIAGNILSCYNNVAKFTTPIINQVEFEKSVTEDKINFILPDVMKSWTESMIAKLEAEKDKIKKSELDEQIQKEIAPLAKVDVVFNNVVKSMYVDIIDIETKKYKDNSLTKKLSLAGKAI